MTETLKINKEFASIRERFEEDATQKTFNALIAGEVGSGKTFLLHTARLPVFIDSFDPGGSRSLKPWIDEGKIFVDTRWEGEDMSKPWVFREWAKEFNRRVKEGFFEDVGTYALDSLTTWQDTIMFECLRLTGEAGKTPHDYRTHWGPQKNLIRSNMKVMLSLPCDVIFTAHLKASFNTQDQYVGQRLATTGSLQNDLPLLFDEIYVALTEKTSQGLQYKLLTRSTGEYIARSRLASGRDGKPIFKAKEEPNIKALLKKAGYDVTDKPY